MIAPAAALTGLILIARRNFDKHHPPEEFEKEEHQAKDEKGGHDVGA